MAISDKDFKDSNEILEDLVSYLLTKLPSLYRNDEKRMKMIDKLTQIKDKAKNIKDKY